VTDTSRQVILVCEECGERTVLEGHLSVWGPEGSVFGCECGELLTPASGVEAPATDGERGS
jgi:hypothetical protein